MKSCLLITAIVTGASSLQAQTSLAQLSSPSLDPTTNVYPAPTLSNSPSPKADPVMTEELMARLIKRTLASKIDTIIPAATCSVFNLSEAGHDLPAKIYEGKARDGRKHLFMVPVEEGCKDIVIEFVYAAKAADIYLTDKSAKLRAAAHYDGSTIRLILNEAAAEKFKAELAVLAKHAATLPPTDGAGRGNK